MEILESLTTYLERKLGKNLVNMKWGPGIGVQIPVIALWMNGNKSKV